MKKQQRQPRAIGTPRFLMNMLSEQKLQKTVGNTRESYRQLYYSDSLTADPTLTAIKHIKPLQDVHFQDVLAISNFPKNFRFNGKFNFADGEKIGESVFDLACGWTKIFTHQIAFCQVKEKLAVFARQDIPWSEFHIGLVAGQLVWGDQQEAKTVCTEAQPCVSLYESKESKTGVAYQCQIKETLHIANINSFYLHAPSEEGLARYWLDPEITGKVATANMKFFNVLLEKDEKGIPLSLVKQIADIHKDQGIYASYLPAWNECLSRRGKCAPLFYKDGRAIEIPSHLYYAPISIAIPIRNEKDYVLSLSGALRRDLLNNRNSGEMAVEIMTEDNEWMVTMPLKSLADQLEKVKPKFGFLKYTGPYLLEKEVKTTPSPALSPCSPLLAAASDLGLQFRRAVSNTEIGYISFCVLLVELIKKDKNLINQADEETGKTPLHLAIETRQTQKVETLILMGADLNLSDKSGKTPLARAQEMQSPEIIKLLEDAQKKIASGLGLK